MAGSGYFSRDASIRSGAWRASVAVLAMAGCVVLLGGQIVSEMLHKTRSLGWQTPKGSASLEAEEATERYFPKRLQGSIIMAIEALPETTTVLTDAVAAWSRNVSHQVAQDSRTQSFKPVVLGYYLDAPGGFAMQQLVHGELVSSDKRMTLIFIQPTTTDGDIKEANAFLQEFCQQPPHGYVLHITGMPAVLAGDGCFGGVHAKMNTRDMNFELIFKAEMMTVPVALFIIGRMVKHIRLLLLPVALVIVSFIVSAAILTPWMDVIPIAHDVPAAMGSVIMALCLDYSLFFLSRFGEQHADGWSLQDNVDVVVRETGHTIMVSGTLVAIAFFTSMVLPEDNLKGSGLCLGFAVVSCVVTSAALIPAMLLVGGKMLSGRVLTKSRMADLELDGRRQREEMQSDEDAGRRPHVERSYWLRMMRMIDRSPLCAIGAVVLGMSPLFACLPMLNVSGDRFALLPMGMPALQALWHIQQVFPVGVLDPYAVVISAPTSSASGLASPELLDALGELKQYNSQTLAAHMTLSPAELTSVTSALQQSRAGSHGALVPHSVVARAVAETHAQCSDLAAVGAGAALEAAKHESAAVTLRAALRAADATGCGEVATRRAVVASAAETHGRVAGKDAEDMAAAAHDEALRLGWSEDSAARLAVEVAQAARDEPRVVQKDTLKAVRAGALAVRSRSGTRTTGPSSEEHSIPRTSRDITASDVIDVMAVADRSHGVALGPRRLADLSQGDDALSAAAAAAVTAALLSVRAHGEQTKDLSEDAQERWPVVMDLLDVATEFSAHGSLLLPSGFAAMLDLCNRSRASGSVASMVGPTWAYHRRIDWLTAVAMHANSALRNAYQPLLDSHVKGTRALLELHTTFPSIGAGAANWVVNMRAVLADWEAAHPGYRAYLSGGATRAVDTRRAVLEAMWTYLGLTVMLVMVVVFFTFGSIMIPLRLALALVFTLAATYGAAVVIYQTSLFHGVCPWLKPFDGLTYEVVPMVTGVCIALGLDYDIFLVSRVAEFRSAGFSDRASVFRGATKAGGVISGAGLIMSLAFSGLCFSDKLMMQQFGVLLVISVMFDTFVVRTILVPALMLVAEDWNWWPRKMPAVLYNSLEGEEQSSDNLYRPLAD